MDRREICCSTHGDGKPDVPCAHSPTGLIRDRYRDDASALAAVDGIDDDDAKALEEVGRRTAERIYNQHKPGWKPSGNAGGDVSPEQAVHKANERILNQHKPNWRPNK
jgi:hypothetical protein